MMVLAGGDLVLPDRMMTASLVVDDGRIVSIDPPGPLDAAGATVVDARGCYVVPGFIDVHVHGVLGHDTLDEGDVLHRIAAALPRFGVTAFCPTSVACTPPQLERLLSGIAAARTRPASSAARVLPAHLESNFINPEFRGAQPLDCIRQPSRSAIAGTFSGEDVLEVMAAHRADIGIVTLAPEIAGGLDLVRRLAADGYRVSIGHTGASFDEASAAIDAGARHATHLFNRMPPMTHRAPGAAGAVLSREEVTAELICDGYHVHPAVCRVAIGTKGMAGVMAITDATGGAGLAPGSTARLGGRTIAVGDEAAFLPDGTLAGSTLTMDRAFATIVTRFGMSIPEAAQLCATTPARALGLTGFGVIAAGAVADLVVLDAGFRVRRTFVAGRQVYPSEP